MIQHFFYLKSLSALNCDHSKRICIKQSFVAWLLFLSVVYKTMLQGGPLQFGSVQCDHFLKTSKWYFPLTSFSLLYCTRWF